MPLVRQGGLTGKKAGLQGIQDVVASFVAGKEGVKKQAQDDAMKIWQMAQNDPLILQSPQAQQTFKMAGWPVPTRAGNFEAPKMLAGRDTYSQWNRETGQWGPTDIKTPRGGTQEGWGQINQLLNIRKNAQDAGNQEVVNTVDQVLNGIMPPKPTPSSTTPPAKPGWWSRLWSGGPAAPPATGTPNPLGQSTDTLPPIGAMASKAGPDFGALANQWLQPDQFTGFMPPPAPGAGTVSRPSLPSAIKGGNYVPSFRGFGAPPATGRPSPTAQPRPGPAPSNQTQAGSIPGPVAPLLPFDVVELAKKLDPASKQQLIQIIKEGDPKKMQAAYDRMKATYAPVR